LNRNGGESVDDEGEGSYEEKVCTYQKDDIDACQQQ